MGQIDPGDSNPSRQRILDRIRKALQVPAIDHSPPQGERRLIFEPITDLVERFQAECSGNKTECTVTPDFRAAAVAVHNVLDSLPAGEVFVQDTPKFREIACFWNGGNTRRVVWSTEGTPKENVQATITRAEALVALTGSVLFSAACGGREAAVVAPVHVVVASLDDLVTDIGAAFARARERGALQLSYLTLITGSSRTADIEKILVMGAHGPRRLAVILSLEA